MAGTATIGARIATANLASRALRFFHARQVITGGPLANEEAAGLYA